MRRLLQASAFGLVLAASAQAAPGDQATAELKNLQGQAIGTVTLTETPHGILLSGELGRLPPGPHGVHLHAVGKCEPPFTSAGGHFNPANHKHGFMAAEGPHAGDLPNLHAAPDGKATVDAFAAGVTLAGAQGLLDQDGASLVVHAKADDYKTDPAGDSGDRIACGVLEKSR